MGEFGLCKNNFVRQFQFQKVEIGEFSGIILENNFVSFSTIIFWKKKGNFSGINWEEKFCELRTNVERS